MEIFTQISDRYYIGNKGTVRTIGKNLSQKTKSNGYKEVCLYIDKKPKMNYVHRLVAQYFIGDIPEGYAVNHKDGNKANNDVCNLEIVSYSENSSHSYHVLGNKIKPKKGAEHHKSKVTEEEVLKIRSLYDSGADTRDIHNGFPMLSLSGIRKICYRSTWKHL